MLLLQPTQRCDSEVSLTGDWQHNNGYWFRVLFRSHWDKSIKRFPQMHTAIYLYPTYTWFCKLTLYYTNANLWQL